jgi:hypothetical protein
MVRCLLLLLIAVACLFGATRAFAERTSGRAYSVADLAAGTNFLRASDSPDGQWTVFVTRQGDITRNANVFSIYGANRGELRLALETPARRLTPRLLFRTSTGAFEDGRLDAIDNITWSDDSARVFFTARSVGDGEQDQVFDLNIETGELRQRTRVARRVEAFAAASQADITVVCGRTSVRNETARADDLGVLITTQTLGELRAEPQISRTSCTLETSIATVRDLGFEWSGGWPTISPDGRWLIEESFFEVQDRPDWRAYGNGYQILHNGVASFVSLQRIDLNTGASSRLVDRPLAIASLRNSLGPGERVWIRWAPDARSVAVAGVGSLLSDGAPLSQSLVLNPDGGLRAVLGEAPNDPVVRWLELGQVEVRNTISRIEYRQAANGWLAETGPIRDEPLTVWENGYGLQPYLAPSGLQEARGVWADAGQRRLKLMDLDPPDLAPRSIEQYTWRDRRGRTYQGVLSLPLHFEPGRRYPVVIAINASAFADSASGPLRVLNGRGILTLSTACRSEEPTPDHILEATTPCIDAAVDALEQAGRIDSDRVGLLGFSYSGMLIQHSLVFSNRLFAAASIVDAAEATPFAYALVANSPMWDQWDTPSYAGGGYNLFPGPPFGGSLRDWFNNSSAFSLDRVYTPTRYEFH